MHHCQQLKQVLAHADLHIQHKRLSARTQVTPQQDHAVSRLMLRAPAPAAVNTMAEEGLRAGPKQVSITLPSDGADTPNCKIQHQTFLHRMPHGCKKVLDIQLRAYQAVSRIGRSKTTPTASRAHSISLSVTMACWAWSSSATCCKNLAYRHPATLCLGLSRQWPRLSGL